MIKYVILFQIKCHQYFPEGSAQDGENEMIFDDVDLKVTYISEDDLNYFTIRTLEIQDLRVNICGVYFLM